MTNHRTATVPAALDQPDERAVHRAGCVVAKSDTTSDDAAHLRRFCDTGDAAAFAVLMTRHIGWVSRLVRRQVKDVHLAEDITQAVFIILARKAHTIRAGASLSAWLFRVARFAANDAVKHETRRRKRLARVVELHPTSTNGDSHEDSPVGCDLDDAIACLGQSDRQILLLRFYQDMSIAQVSRALDIQEDAAKKRISRALQRLRKVLAGKGIRITSIAMLMALLDQNRVEASQAGSVTAPTSTSGRAVELANSSIRALGSAHTKLLAAMSAGALAALLMGMAVIVSMMMHHASGKPMPTIEIASAHTSSSDGSIARSDVGVENPTPNESTEQPGEAQRMWIGQTNSWGLPVPLRAEMYAPIPLRSLSGAEYSALVMQDDQDQWWYQEFDSNPQEIVARRPSPQLLMPPQPADAFEKPSLLDQFDLHGPNYFAPVARKWRRATLSPHSGEVSLQMEIDETYMGAESGASIVPEPSLPVAVLLLTILATRRRRRE